MVFCGLAGVWVLTAMDHPRSVGIDVHVLPPSALKSAFDPLTQAIVIRVADGRHYYLNSESVPLVALPASLENLFRTRANWTVYVIGDSEADYGDVVEAMDAVRTAHGTVVLLTSGEAIHTLRLGDQSGISTLTPK